MSVELQLSAELESQLATEAAGLGLALPDYALRLVLAGRESRPVVQSGDELLKYWQTEQLVATRSEIKDSSAHARMLRTAAETRSRP